MEINHDTPKGMDTLYPMAHPKSPETTAPVCGMSGYEFAPTSDTISCMAGGEEMLRVSPNGFWVRGQRVEQDDREAEIVYNAFKAWMSWAQLNKDYK